MPAISRIRTGTSRRARSTRNCCRKTESARRASPVRNAGGRADRSRDNFPATDVRARRLHPDNLPMRLLTLFLAAVLPLCAGAQQAGSVVTPARDATAIYIAQGNFIIQRLGSECLGVVGRAETPETFVANWRRRNARYVEASAKYMDQRVQEAAAVGPDRRDALLNELRQAVQGNGEAALQGLLQGGKADGCMYGVTLVDTGALDISSKLPQFEQLEALARWAAQ